MNRASFLTGAYPGAAVSRVITPSQNSDPVPMDVVQTNGESQWKTRQTTQGAGDGSTLDVALTLRGHNSEVRITSRLDTFRLIFICSLEQIFACAFNPVYPRILVTG